MIAALLGGVGIGDVEVDRAVVGGIDRAVIRVAQIVVEDDSCVDGLDDAADLIDRSALVIEGQGRVVEGFVDAEIGAAAISDDEIASVGRDDRSTAVIGERIGIERELLPPVAVSVPVLVRVVTLTVKIPSVDSILPVLSTFASTMALVPVESSMPAMFTAPSMMVAFSSKICEPAAASIKPVSCVEWVASLIVVFSMVNPPAPVPSIVPALMTTLPGCVLALSGLL